MSPLHHGYCRPLLSGVALAIALLAGTVARAQPEQIPMSPELKAYLTRPDQQQLYNGNIAQQWRIAVENCPSPQMRSLNVLVGVPPKFNASGNPVSGEWRVVSRVEGCGASRILSVAYTVGTDGKIHIFGLLPGTTAASPLLQRDALLYARMGMAGLASKDCKDITYSDTKFIDFVGAASSGASGRRPWIEEWTVRSCGVTGVVTVHFTPDATGTTISTNLSETRKIGP